LSAAGSSIASLLAPMLAAASLPVFEDITARSGVDFRHDKSGTSRKYLIESASGGVAMFDYDGDGLLDLYFVNGAALADPMKEGGVADKSAPRFWNRLYRNRGGGRFEDVTEKAGVRGRGYGMGAAAGDYDGDGRADLYVTNFGANILYRNRGDGTFEDATARAGVRAGGWSAGAAWVDYDHDGHLDLIVARYLTWDFEPDIWCGSRGEGHRSYCHPNQFPPATHIVYRNRGDGTFEDATAKAGWSRSPGKGFGVAIGDYDRDGKVDIVVANDSYPQQLFRNLGGGRFEETGLDAGIAYDDDGRVYAGMGVDFADYDNDGWPDVFINALALQRYALYRNVKGVFEYVSTATGVGAITRMRSGWGARFLDYDNDGWRDLFVAQGHVMDNIALTQPAVRYREPLLLMRNLGGRFADVSASSGDAFQRPLAARGAAFGDLDNDGWIDVAVNCNDGPAVILRNRGAPGAHWLMVDAPIGSLVRVVDASGREQHAMASAAGSYLSSNDPRVHFGLGTAARVTLIEVVTPGGRVARRTDLEADRVIRLP
jgi:hypothetical protein